MKRIPLTQGKFALVDDGDFDFLSQWKWRHSKGYAVRNRTRSDGCGSTQISMHQQIMWMAGHDFQQVDHKDLNRLNNRRFNLRPATKLQNNLNRARQSNNQCGFKGVYWERPYGTRRGRWRMKITIGDKKKTGSFTTKEEASRAYAKAAKELHGEFARIN